jgi:hypothetical protein
MKHLVILALAMLLIPWSSVTGDAQEMYWDPGQSEPATVAKGKETKFPKAETAKSLAEKEIYDSGEPPSLGSDEEEEPAVTTPPRRRASVDRPRSGEAAPSRTQTRSRRTTTPAKDEQTTVKELKKKPASKRSTTLPAATEDAAKTPASEPAPPAEPAGKLQWGRDK